MSKSIVEMIASANFMADIAQVERLAGNVAEGQVADATYLRVVLAHMQANLGKGRRGRRATVDAHSAEVVLDKVHEQFYPAVLKGVGGDELPVPERHRRATFARSAASTVRYFIRNGGDVRDVDVSTVTKSGLRKLVKPEAPPPENETRAERAFRKATEVVVSSAQRLLARGDPDIARERIEATLEALEALLTELPEQPEAGQTTVVASRSGVRGTPAHAPMLHRGV